MRTVIAVSRETVRRAQAEIGGCEACSVDAEILFEFILDEVTGRNPLTTDYVLSEPAACPECGADVFEDTLVEPSGMDHADRIYPSFLN